MSDCHKKKKKIRWCSAEDERRQSIPVTRKVNERQPESMAEVVVRRRRLGFGCGKAVFTST